MMRTVTVFGLLSGIGMALLQWIIYPLCYRGYVTFDNSTYVGYAGMLLVFSMIYFGIRSYRDNQGNGSVSFLKALQIGLGITIIGSLLHALGWQIYNLVNPDFKRFFLEKFTEYQMARVQNAADPTAIAEIQQQIDTFKRVYENPLLDMLVSAMLIFPAGLVVTVISGLLLRQNLPADRAKGGER